MLIRRVLRTRIVPAWVAVALILFGGVLAPGTAAATDVIGDDERDMFVGSGSLILPISMYSQGRSAAATCPGCRWRATLACDKVTAGSCRGPARLCGPDGEWLRIWIMRPGGEWEDLGAACFGPEGPATRDRVELRVREIVEQLVPPLRPAAQPANGILPHLPVVFRSGQSGTPVSGRHWVLDIPLEINATARWDWDFGDGARLATRHPGARWPDVDVAHTYRAAGSASVRVVTTWSATFTVDGVGPLEVAQPVRQDRGLDLRVGEGRAILVR